MNIIYTIGYAQKSLEQFIKLLKENGITSVIDVRLYRNSQWIKFAKEGSLKHLLEQHLNIKYKAMPELAPTPALLKAYRKNKSWENYEQEFNEIIKGRHLERFKDNILGENENVCFLCMESKPDKCHRRLIAEFFSGLKAGAEVVHL
ncbi:MAG TPA: DUF488 domain-containing protein [Nanoarchaeota archaeon]|nr:DUF488 domain-containing protein [Nanoarchaeota archaeon]